MLSISFNDNYRVCAFQDTTEPSHTFPPSATTTKHHTFLPLFRNNLSEHFIDLEDKLIGKSSKAS